jgi:hypothetical protein
VINPVREREIDAEVFEPFHFEFAIDSKLRKGVLTAKYGDNQLSIDRSSRFQFASTTIEAKF